MNSTSVFAGTLLLIVRNSGTVPTGPTGMRSLSGSAHRLEQIRIDCDVAGVGEAERVAVGAALATPPWRIAAPRGAVSIVRLAGLGRDVVAEDASHDVGRAAADVDTMILISFEDRSAPEAGRALSATAAAMTAHKNTSWRQAQSIEANLSG
jgi:hypothetical protein